MKKSEIDRKVSQLKEVDERIQSSLVVAQFDLKLSEKLRTELHGHWDTIKGSYIKKK